MKTTFISTGRILQLSALVLTLGALTTVAGLTGCAGDRYTRSTGEMIDDKAQSARVNLALSKDTEYKYSDVKVQTFKHTVQLSGFVNSRDQKNRAGEIAKRVEGIREVQNNITVKESSN